MNSDIDRSLTGKFSKSIWSKFRKSIEEYRLIENGDRIAVCISGGKDSMLMAKLFQELKRHNKFPFELAFLVMDPGYSQPNRAQIEYNAAIMEVPLTVFESDIFDSVVNVDKSPCYLCARMRRGHLYKKAQELGCNKIALGHHYDDVIETNLMSMLWGGQIQTMMPKLHSTNFEGMELIRPLYCVHEDDIIAWARYNDLRFIQCACRFTDAAFVEETGGTKRREIKELIRELKKTNPNIEKSIFNSLHRVHLDTFVGFKTKGEYHSFLERY
jgi:tRNA(Ile)-lysidine synthase TilS/MesJ